MEWINPKKPDKEPKREKEGLIITKKKRKKEAEWFQVLYLTLYVRVVLTLSRFRGSLLCTLLFRVYCTFFTE